MKKGSLLNFSHGLEPASQILHFRSQPGQSNQKYLLLNIKKNLRDNIMLEQIELDKMVNINKLETKDQPKLPKIRILR